jgi:arsenate reductase
MPDRKRVLFLCTENSCRSQMAEGFLRSAAPDKYDAASAGSVSTSVNPNAVKVMSEAGVDISHHKSKSVDQFADQFFDYVITVCGSAKDGSCPTFHGRAGERLHWPCEDPAKASGDEEKKLEIFRKVRDNIRDRVECFLRREAAQKPPTK